AIFASAIAALVLVLAMVEQLGAPKLWISHVMILTPLALLLCVTALTRTLDKHEFMAAGRRVPAVYGGLSMAATMIGGTGFFALTGALYLIGFDALALALGAAAGFVLTAVLITPYLRKSGAYTLPGFFRQRLKSRVAGAAAALLLIPPALLLIAAEMRLGGFVASLFVSVSFEAAIAAGAALAIAIVIIGGMRSVAWTQAVLYFLVITAFLVPLVIVSLKHTNLPIPQLTYGELLDRVASQEIALGSVQAGTLELGEALPGERPEPALKPFMKAFGAISRGDFLLLVFCFMCGTAAMPSLLTRAGTAPSIHESRRAIGWGALFLGLFLITAPAYALFTKFLILQEIVGTTPSQLPEWITGLRDAGLADFSDRNGDGVIGAAEMLVSRDGVTLALPIVAHLPFVTLVLVAVGGIVAVIGATAAHGLSIGAAVGDDLFRGLVFPRASPGRQLFAARVGAIAALLPTAWFVSMQDFDILPAVAWAMSLSAATFLPATVLAVWWDRLTVWGLLAGMAAGFATTAGYIAFVEFGDMMPVLGVSSLVAGIFGVPAAALGAVGASLLTPAPGADIVALAREVRDPSGETIQDRAIRVAAQAQAAASEGGAAGLADEGRAS
ncbi:MAG: hypothetical protein D6773_02610, partial [Alphaproteobacteria bacterium]